MDVSMTSTSIDWFAGGFIDSSPNINEAHRTLGAPWMLLRGADNDDGTAVSAFPKDSAAPNNVTTYDANLASPFAGTFKIQLDTTQPFWKVDWFFNNVNIKTFTFTSGNPNPSITAVGFSSWQSATGRVDNFTLSYVPEPTTALAGVLLGAGLLRRRRARQA